MRERLERLSRISTGINDAHYLHYKYLFRDLQSAVARFGSGDVLDIGCGNKPYKDLFRQDRVSSYIGCDVAQSDKNLVDILCPATEIPLPPDSRDTVITTQVLEHVANHGAVVSEAFRILKPGGYIIASAPMCWEHHEEPYDFFRFTRYGFEYVLRDAGFQVIEIRANGGKWALVGQILLNSIRSSCERRRGLRKVVWLMYSGLRVKWMVNGLFSWLDRVDMDETATLNFVVVGRKPQNAVEMHAGI
jgi:SAM-dependent methyltransferase